MPTDVSLSLSTVFGFLLVLARMSGAFVFVPLPGVKDGPLAAKAVLSVCITFSMFPLWPAVNSGEMGVGRLAGWMLAEAALGATIGLVVAFIAEAVLLSMQIAGLQAGYAYASVVDPNTQADSGVLLVLAQLMSGLLFFALGLDREVIKILARSLAAHPPGTFALTRPMAEQILRLGADVFTIGLRLAMPVVALLALVDISLALLGRVNAQLQLLTLAFPVKMLVALVMLTWIAAMLPGIYRSHGEQMLTTAGNLVGR
jgi:flagellar biosynthesis protein FliR